jgi:ureidoglycolate lyase
MAAGPWRQSSISRGEDLRIRIQKLDVHAFAPFGQVLAHQPGLADRRNFAAELFNDRPAARPNLRVQRTQPTPLPHTATKIERHRRSSQMFAPISCGSYLVVVFPSDPEGLPILDGGRAFAARGNQAVNYNRDVWHHGFLALERPGTFLMLRWEDGTSGDEEFLPLPHPIRIEWDGAF